MAKEVLNCQPPFILQRNKNQMDAAAQQEPRMPVLPLDVNLSMYSVRFDEKNFSLILEKRDS